MPEFKRVRDPETGDEFTYDDAKIAALGLEKHVTSKEALGADGLPAPAKPRLPLGEPRPGSASERRRTAKKTTGTKRSGKDAGQTSATDKEN